MGRETECIAIPTDVVNVRRLAVISIHNCDTKPGFRCLDPKFHVGKRVEASPRTNKCILIRHRNNPKADKPISQRCLKFGGPPYHQMIGATKRDGGSAAMG